MKKVKLMPQIVERRRVIEWPRCQAEITSEESIRYRQNPGNRRRFDGLNCGNVATYTIDGEWFCRKHAAYIALDILALQADEP